MQFNMERVLREQILIKYNPFVCIELNCAVTRSVVVLFFFYHIFWAHKVNRFIMV